MGRGQKRWTRPRLRTLWRRPSWVRIPPPAPNQQTLNTFSPLQIFSDSPTILAHGDSAKVTRIYFPDPLSVRVGFWACFFETGLLSACFGVFYPRGVPQAY